MPVEKILYWQKKGLAYLGYLTRVLQKSCLFLVVGLHIYYDCIKMALDISILNACKVFRSSGIRTLSFIYMPFTWLKSDSILSILDTCSVHLRNIHETVLFFLLNLNINLLKEYGISFCNASTCSSYDVLNYIQFIFSIRVYPTLVDSHLKSITCVALHYKSLKKSNPYSV